MARPLALDIYGTLVDPLAIDEHLREIAGERAGELAALWRRKQLEFAFRRALMRDYEDFGVVSRQALVFAARCFHAELSAARISAIMEQYHNLPPFPDAVAGLQKLRSAGYPLVAFSNGPPESTRRLLRNAGLLEYLEGVVSTDDVGSFKPDPEVYYHLARTLQRAEEEIWLISSNSFDVLGALHAGLRTVWVRRDDIPFDPWNRDPDITVSSLKELPDKLQTA